MTWRVVAVAAVIVTVMVYAVGSGTWVSTGTAWYLALAACLAWGYVAKAGT